MTESQSAKAKEPAPRELIHITIPVGMLQCNCTIIGDPLTLEALVIDPGDEVSRITDLLTRHNLSVKAIISTHAHIADHVAADLANCIVSPARRFSCIEDFFKSSIQAAWIIPSCLSWVSPRQSSPASFLC